MHGVCAGRLLRANAVLTQTSYLPRSDPRRAVEGHCRCHANFQLMSRSLLQPFQLEAAAFSRLE